MVAATIDAGRTSGQGTLVGYLPAGFPSLEEGIDAAVALAENGVDVIELGIPYSDPVMDGPVIQRATQRALSGGFRVRDTFTAVRRITEQTHIPVLVMTYWNPVLQFGARRFTDLLLDSGGSGLITPDLIPDEAQEWLQVSDATGAERVFLAAPTSTDERLARVAGVSRGFVYAVSTMGITGARDDVDQAARTLVGRLRVAGAQHVCVGIGISTGSQVSEVLGYADGAIVGSALIAALERGGPAGLARKAAELSAGKPGS
jgi:tryptophan synthase alpha chain